MNQGRGSAHPGRNTQTVNTGAHLAPEQREPHPGRGAVLRPFPAPPPNLVLGDGEVGLPVKLKPSLSLSCYSQEHLILKEIFSPSILKIFEPTENLRET